MMRDLVIVLIGVAVSLPAPVRAQHVTSRLIELPDRTIEVSGLKRWTAEMIQDSLNVHAPGDSLHHHACAATLRFQLGFAEAASLIIRRSDGTVYAFVPVIEPQDSAIVHHRDLPLDTTGSLAPWAPLVAWSRADLSLLQRVLASRIRARGIGLPEEVPEGAGTDPQRFREIAAYLQRSEPADADTARKLLMHSPYLWDRVAAVAILSEFDRDDTTWHALAGALLESRGVAHTVAGQVLAGFAREMPRPVDWKPAGAQLHAVLNGSSLFDLHWVLDMLVRTGAGPGLAGPLLKDGGHAVLMYAGAAHPLFRGAAHRFLRVVSANDYGADPEQWRAWMQNL